MPNARVVPDAERECETNATMSSNEAFTLKCVEKGLVKSCDWLRTNKNTYIDPPIYLGCGREGKPTSIHANVNVQPLSQNSGGIR